MCCKSFVCGGKRILALLLSLAAVFSLFSCSTALTGGAVSGSGEIWTVGCASCEIPIPDVSPLYVAGYKNNNPATGTLDPMCARAVWLDDNSGEGGALLISIDCVGLSQNACDIIRRSLSDFSSLTGCRAIHVSATHTHAGIDTLGLWGEIAVDGKNDEFMDGLFDSAVSAANSAYQSRSDGRLYYGSCGVSELLRDSRPPETVNGELSLFRFESDGGKDAAMVVLGAHPESLGGSNSLVSADFVSVICEKLKRDGYEPIFFAGELGGLISTVRQSDDNVENMTLTGELLYEKLSGIDSFTELSPSLLTVSEDVVIALDNGVFVIMTFLGVLDTNAVVGASETGLSVATEVSYMRLGSGEASVGLAMVPGEVDPIVMREVHGLFEGKTVTIGLCDDEIGYILPKDGFLVSEELPYLEEAVDGDGEGHYEETNSVGRSAGDEIIAAFGRISEKIREITD